MMSESDKIVEQLSDIEENSDIADDSDAMVKRALNVTEEKTLITKTLQCLDKEQAAVNKSKGNLFEDEALDWLKPRSHLMKMKRKRSLNQLQGRRILREKSVDTQTIPPPRANYGATCLQCIIFDFYQEDYARKMKEKEDEKPKRLKKKTAKHVKSAQQIHDEQLAQRIREAWAILERLVNQNVYDDIAQDFRYWDDPSDEFREGMGSVLPLWKFQYEPMRNHAVCDLQWNPHYQDLFAEKTGCLCLYSIKNPAYPEYAVVTDSPVICLDVYKEVPYLVCVGLYDGNVCVYNAQLTLESSYQYKSDSVRDKHSNIVWEQPPKSHVSNKGCGSCICFHPEKADIFMVGTEDGMIHTCSLKYNRNYVSSVQAHHMPVEPLFMFELGSPVGDVKWAPYSSTVFAACTSDGRIMKLDKLLSLIRDPPFQTGVVDEKFEDDN
ncbi:Dynein intermediate chain 2, ciliary [Operophtera brumata]|uniref:Dynein intermediate chain 2, ciliary n=1 Tax=Operophtera brumata TaxID=104452 RepID=A0A0L7L8E7_OPEBR|nr:Dynein intermediate chain 2, ciliary [Operophtera brumata]